VNEAILFLVGNTSPLEFVLLVWIAFRIEFMQLVVDKTKLELKAVAVKVHLLESERKNKHV
jgi:hypothetical protein